ncbi:cyclic nucleotide-binding domain-containing protein [Myxococcus stipitatus DSM 14675]|uniref:Cyclic nucleotide-binding domain-containing protein n=1 Tax=Myxococcus stipitatus (strain DSM 14675 / JCM 12634 / Mx s8) TaxID=1278073 RepID=L7UBV6_MYXSD|nr:cyclic nucleotide-binding domain-containing protein [Myxococcus stipitatus]AGC45375.1 cyclic nucleotide-binding domain-containing protein [Myxococcus stipitatus DSM 14675]
MEARKLKDSAAEAFSKGRFSKAAELYEDFCKLDPKDHQSRLRTGDAWAKAGERERAILAYQSAAEGFAKEGFLPRAIAASKLILELDPSHQGVQQMLANLYARRGTPVGARARGPMTSALAAPPPPERPASAQPEAGEGRPPEALEAGTGAVDLSAELPAELSLSIETPSSPEAAGGSEELVVHSVSVGLTNADAEAPGAHVAEGIDIPLGEPPARAPSLPPGLSPRVSPPSATEEVRASIPAPPPPRAASGKWKALASPIADTAAMESEVSLRTPTVIDPPSAPPGLRPRRTEVTPASGATAVPFREVSRALGASLRAVPPIPSSFTELELEADSLLHAVELAAQSGRVQRAQESDGGLEEEVFSLTEEVVTDVPSLDTLPTIPLFSDLPRDAFIELFERCPLRRFQVGERIIEQGSRGDAFYVICEGKVRVFRSDNAQRVELAVLEGGAFFGEMALLSGAPRTASVEAGADDTQLLEISAPVLASLSRSHPQVAAALKKFVRQRLLTNVMNTSALFRPFNRKDRRTLVERFRARDVEREDVIIRDGDPTDGLYVLLSGEVEVHKDGHLLTRLKEGDLFGEISLLQKTPATATVMASRHTTLLRLPREDFDALISSHPQILVLVSELTDERLRRTEAVLGASSALDPDSMDLDEDLILV